MAALYIQQSVEKMLNVPLGLLVLHHQHLGDLYSLARFGCEIVVRYRHL